MRLLGILLSYTAAIGVLCAALIGGTLWLVQPGAAVSGEPRAAPIPPRIAESIERKKPLPVKESEPEPMKPAMTEANVSLAPAPVQQFKIRELSPPPKQARKPRRERSLPTQEAASAAPAAVVSTARTDVPF
jgi:hypothetical protein